MKLKLTNLLENAVLLEGRLEDIKAKYVGDENLVDRLSNNDPSGNNKYLAWMAKQAIQNNEPIVGIIDAISLFHTSGGRLKKEKKSFDINTYEAVESVTTTIGTLNRRETPSKSELKGLAELVYDGPNLYVVAPRNYEGSCKFGAGAKWCVAQDTSDSYWKSYTKNNLFYFIISKKLASSDDAYKVAIEKNLSTGKNTYWNVPDRNNDIWYLLH